MSKNVKKIMVTLLVLLLLFEIVILPSCQMDNGVIRRWKLIGAEKTKAINILYENTFDFDRRVDMYLYMEDENDENHSIDLVRYLIYDKNIMIVDFYDEAKEIDFLQPFYTNDECYISSFKEQAVVLIDFWKHFYIEKVYTDDVSEYNKLFNIDINQYNCTAFANMVKPTLFTAGVYYEFHFEKMITNPLKNLVLDNCNVDYLDDSLTIFSRKDSTLFKIKIRYQGSERWLILSCWNNGIEDDEWRHSETGFLYLQNYIDSRNEFDTFEQWPEYYTKEIVDSLGEVDVPCPEDISKFNDMLSYPGLCILTDHMPSIDFRHNYENKLIGLGYEYNQNDEYWYKNAKVNNNEYTLYIIVEDYGEEKPTTIYYAINEVFILSVKDSVYRNKIVK